MIQATDLGSPSLSGTAELLIDVEDINDCPPVFITTGDMDYEAVPVSSGVWDISVGLRMLACSRGIYAVNDWFKEVGVVFECVYILYKKDVRVYLWILGWC